MSYRSLLRQPPKRMLLYFNADQTTCVYQTSKAKKIVQGDMIREGATVLVDFEKKEFEACILKLHDDPSILRQAQLDFERTMMLDDDRQDDDDAADKENNSAVSNDAAVVMSLKAKRKETKRRKTNNPPQHKQKKAKKLITIEAEGLPDDSVLENEGDKDSINAEATNSRKDPLTFLHPEEQEKVKKLVSMYERVEKADVAMQTENVIREKAVSNAGVQTEHHEPGTNQNYSFLSLRIGTIEDKLDELITLFTAAKQTGVSFNGDLEENNFDDKSSVGLDDDSSIMRTIQDVASFCTNNTLPGMSSSWIEENQLERIEPVRSITPTIYDELFKRSSSISNFAKNLVFQIFDHEELKQSNCSGAHNKKSLEKDPRMESIKDIVFKKFPSEDRGKSWAMCRRAIDSAIRKMRFKLQQ